MSYFLFGTDSKEDLLSLLASSPALALDMESVNDIVIGLGAGTDQLGGYAEDADSILEMLTAIGQNPHALRILHNGKADTRALVDSGYIEQDSELLFPMWDTMIAASLLEYPFIGLQYLASVVLGIEIDSFSSITKRYECKDLSDVPVEEIARYNLSQIICTYKLYVEFSAALEAKQLSRAFELEMGVLPVISEMETNGFAIDAERLAQLEQRFIMEGEALEAAVSDMTDGHVRNVNSPKQVSDYIFGKDTAAGQLATKIIYKSKRTGKASTSERVIKKLIEKNPEKFAWGRVLLRARQIKKLASTYCRGILKTLRSGRSHTELSQTTAETRRLASQHPNHQNIPKRRIEGLMIRRCFVPRDGYVLVVADKDQLELRLIAEASQEVKLIEAFLTGEDVHKKTAMDLFQDATKRFAGKVLNYTIVYLAGAQQIADQTGRSKKVAEGWRAKYFRIYKKLARWIEVWAAECEAKGYVETMSGARRDVTRFYALSHEEGVRKSVNTKIQGDAAVILKEEMIRVEGKLREYRAEGVDARLLIQVHDELVVEVRKEHYLLIAQMLQDCMTDVYGEMPLPVTVKWGENWAELESVKGLEPTTPTAHYLVERGVEQLHSGLALLRDRKLGLDKKVVKQIEEMDFLDDLEDEDLPF